MGLYWLIDWILGEIYSFLCGHKRRSLEYDKQIIEANQKVLNKLPQHVVLALGQENPDPKLIAKFIIWVAIAGIEHCSIYDYKGNLTLTATFNAE